VRNAAGEKEPVLLLVLTDAPGRLGVQKGQKNESKKAEGKPERSWRIGKKKGNDHLLTKELYSREKGGGEMR